MTGTVIREIGKGVWTFSCPFPRFGFLPIGGRTTAIKLSTGGLWVLASTPLNPETKSKLDELGEVKYIISADAVHHLYLGEFKKAYPSAKLIGPVAAKQRCRDKTLKWDGLWGADPPEAKYGFESDIHACYFAGFRNKDVAFFHPASKAMLQADLLFNLPALEQYSKSKFSGQIPLIGNITPQSWFQTKFAQVMGEDKVAMKRDVNTVDGWDFDKIIPCHGDVIESNGKEAWRSAYRFYLD